MMHTRVGEIPETAEVALPDTRYRISRPAAVLAAVIALFAAGYACADEFDWLLWKAQTDGTVSVLVTGWYPITGDEAVAPGSAGGGWVAVTGDEFVEDLQSASDRVAVSRRYRNFPILSMEMDAAALRRAKSYRGSVEVWENRQLELHLKESAALVGANDAWRRGYRGDGVAVAVIDDGVDTDHAFFAGRIVREACFVRDSTCPNGKNTMIGEGAARSVRRHGSHVSGIVLGYSAAKDLSGVGPDLRLLAINVFDENGFAADDSIIGALNWVATYHRENPGEVGAVNMSLGSARNTRGVCEPRGPYAEMLRYWPLDEVPIVVSSGNGSNRSHAEPVGHPACIEELIRVGAVSKSGHVAGFSNSDRSLDLLAPGVDILSADTGGRFYKTSGTSMAAPHVAAALALLYQAVPNSTAFGRLQALKETGRPIIDPRNGHTAPLIDVGRAITYLMERTRAPSTEPTPRPEPDRDTGPGRQEPEQEQNKDSEWTPITG